MLRVLCGSILTVLLLALVAPPARGADVAGTTGADFLTLGAGARAAALGGANTAWSDDAFGLAYNPAGIARLQRKEVGMAYNAFISDLSHSYLGYVHPFANRYVLGASVSYFDLGRMDRTTVASGLNNQILGAVKGYDVAGGLTLARPISEYVSLGGTVKVIKERLDAWSATAVAADFGLIYRPNEKGLSFGLSGQNLGTRLRLVRRNVDLPASLRFGAAYRTPNGRWGVAGDYVLVRGQRMKAKLGAEYWLLADRFALRGGFDGANDVGRGFTVGAGFRFNDLNVDYAFIPFGDLGNMNLVSLDYRFGAEVPRAQPELAATPAGEHRETTTRPAPVQPPAVRETAPPPVVPALPSKHGIYVTEFRRENVPPDYDWLGAATVEVLRRNWRTTGDFCEDPRQAEYLVSGECRVNGARVTFTAEVWRNRRREGEYSVSAAVDKPFAAWNELTEKLNAHFRKNGYRPVDPARVKQR